MTYGPTPKIKRRTPPTKVTRGKRTHVRKDLNIAMPHKGSARGRKPTLGQQYPNQ